VIEVRELAWPLERSPDAIETLALRANLRIREVDTPLPPETLDESVLDPWIQGTVAWFGLEAETVRVDHNDAEHMLRRGGPAILLLRGEGLLLLAGARRRRVLLIGPDLTEVHIPLEAVREALTRSIEGPIRAELEPIFDRAQIPNDRRRRAMTALLGMRLRDYSVSTAWTLRDDPGESLWQLFRRARAGRKLAALVAAHVAQIALGLLAWWLVGRGVLLGRIDRGWIVAWMLTLVSLIPFRLLASWLASLLAIDLGSVLKQRLLVGALKLEPEDARGQGAGQLLGQAMEAGAIESLGTVGGLRGVIAMLELFAAAMLLLLGAKDALLATLLATWTGLTLALAWRYWKRRRSWTQARLEMTHDLVEAMVGHRTRLAQQESARWHDGEDQTVERYAARARAMDRAGALLSGLIPRGWLALGALGLVPLLSGGTTPSVVSLAVAVWGVLFAYNAFRFLANSLTHVVGAAVAWERVAPLLRAAASRERPGSPIYTVANPAMRPGRVLAEAIDLEYRYRDRGEPVLCDLSLQINAGDRILVEGPSGGGKSTLASLFAGLREPTSGLLLLGGLDRRTLGAEGWRRRVVLAPQFHENHVLTGTVAFNALFGREWPGSLQDLEEAEAICRELALGPIVDRMPSGLFQMIGESGWQLSHGERSRLYIARALLQNADLVILDESLAALDPKTLTQAFECVLRRAKTAMIIAHP
jgi:ATP-binding cassette subfamily B protein